MAPYYLTATEIQTPGMVYQISQQHSTLVFPEGKVEFEHPIELHIPRAPNNDEKHVPGINVFGYGCELVFAPQSPSEFAIQNDELDRANPRGQSIIAGLTIRYNGNAKGGIRLFNLHHSRICDLTVAPFEGGTLPGRSDIGIFLDAFGERTSLNSSGGCNQNVIENCVVGNDVPVWAGENDTTDPDLYIDYGIVLAGSRATRATCGQNLLQNNKVFNFVSGAYVFTGVRYNGTELELDTPMYGYRANEGAVRNTMLACTAIASSSIQGVRYSARRIEKPISEQLPPPPAVKYAARNGLVIDFCHFEKTGVPLLVSHGSDDQVYIGACQFTNSGFSDGDHAIENGMNLNAHVMRYPEENAYVIENGNYVLQTAYTGPFFDPLDRTHYVDDDEMKSDAFDPSTPWGQEANAQNNDENLSTITNLVELELAQTRRRREKTLPHAVGPFNLGA